MAKKEIYKNIGGVNFSLKAAKSFKEKNFKETWGKFLTISSTAAWQQILSFIADNSKKKK